MGKKLVMVEIDDELMELAMLPNIVRDHLDYQVVNYRLPSSGFKTETLRLSELLAKLHDTFCAAVDPERSTHPRTEQRFAELIRPFMNKFGTIYGIPFEKMTRDELIAVIHYYINELETAKAARHTL